MNFSSLTFLLPQINFYPLIFFQSFFFLRLKKSPRWPTSSHQWRFTKTKPFAMLRVCMRSLHVKWNFSFIPWTFKYVRSTSRASRTATRKCDWSGRRTVSISIRSWSSCNIIWGLRCSSKRPMDTCRRRMETIHGWRFTSGLRGKLVSCHLSSDKN